MSKILLGFLLGIITSFLILNHFNWYLIFSPTVMKLAFTTFLALLAGLIALYQVKANVISSARIKWIEDFKNNVAEYIASTNEALFAFELHHRSEDKNETQFYDKCYSAMNKAHIIENKIRLNLNMTEKLHISIDSDLDKIKKLIENKGGKLTKQDEDQINLLFLSLAENTSRSLKIEWEKSKKMFYSRWWEKLNNEN